MTGLRRWTSPLAIAALFVCAPALSQTDAAFPIGDIETAQACYASLDYTCVVGLVSSFPSRYPVSSPGVLPPEVSAQELPVLVEAGRILCVSHLALNHQVEARRAFEWLLELEPDFLLTGPEVPPRFVSAFHQVRVKTMALRRARSMVARSLGLAAAVGVVGESRVTASSILQLSFENRQPSPKLTLDFSLRAGAEWVSFTGRDAQVYADAPGLNLGLDMSIDDTGFFVSMEVGASLHEVLLRDLIRPDERLLRVMNISVYGGRGYRRDWFGLRPSFGLGVTAFGLLSFLEQVGPDISLRLAADAHLPHGLLLSAVGELRAVTIFERDALTSVLRLVGLELGTRF